MIIGVDPHKSSHTATAVDPATNATVASLRVDASLEVVLDVPSTATARIRELSRGGRRKTDVIDAAAAASVAALQGDASQVAGENDTTVFAMLEERRANLAAQRVRVANQLHAVLRDLIPGGAALAVTAKSASALLRSVRPASLCERIRKELAEDLVRDMRTVDASLADIERRMSAALDAHGTRLRHVDGVGAVTAARLLGRTGPASRSRLRMRSLPTPAWRRSRSHPVSGRGIDCHAAAIDNSTRRSISSRSLRCACVPASVAATSTPRSRKARPATKRCVA